MKLLKALLRKQTILWGGGIGAVLVVGVTAVYGLAWLAPDPASDTAQAMIDRVTLHWPVVSQLDSASEVTRNIAYCGGTDPQQKLDLYVPRRETSKPWPLVVYIHGGGWRSGDKRNAVLASYGAGIVQHGWALASVNYRLAPAHTYPAQSGDVSCALKYLRSQAAKNNINASRVVLMGDSAGGQLAALEALKPAGHGAVAGMIDLYGVSNLVTQLQARGGRDKNVAAYLGTRDAARAKEASPITYVGPGAPPFLIIHGLNDKTVQIDQSRELAAALRAAGGRAELIEVRHAGHAFGSASGSSPSIVELSDRIDQFITSVQ